MKKASLNLIDKAVAFLNPQGAVDRLVARQKLVNFSYDAVKYSRERKGPSSLSGAEDYRSNYDRVELMKRARDLAENVGLVRSILMKFASHTAANISYQARTENPEVNTEVEAYWAEWWDKCDLTTRHTGSTLMQVAMMSMLRDGDFLFVLVRDSDGNLKIQGIEADRVGDPFRTYTSLDLIGGIHIDRNTGAPTAYDIFNRSIGDFYTYQATIPSSQAFHLFDPLRIDQYRGVSAFHTAINDCTDIYDIINFEKMAAKNASSQAGIVKRNNNNASDLSSLTNDEDVNGNTIKLEAIQSGKISYLEPGEDIVFPDGPSRPSGAFAEFHKILLRNICLGLGIPYSFAVDPSAMSGPTARLEMQQAGRTFRRYQKLIDDKVLRPIKNIVIADAVSRGLIENNVGTRTTKGIFNFGANVSIDLGRESASAISEFKTGLRTAADIYAERGQDFESAMRQRAIEAKLIKDLAEKYGVAPETISDIVTPTPPQPQLPPTPAPKIVAPAKDEPEGGEDEGGDDEPTPPAPKGSHYMPDGSLMKDEEHALEVKKKETELDCGTGAGGFKEGNTCAGGGTDEPQDPKERGKAKSKEEHQNFIDNLPKSGKEKQIEIKDSETISKASIWGVKRSSQSDSTYGNVQIEINPGQEDVVQEIIEDKGLDLEVVRGDDGDPSVVDISWRVADHAQTASSKSTPNIDIRVGKPKFNDTPDAIVRKWTDAEQEIQKQIQSIFSPRKTKQNLEFLRTLDPASIKMLIEGMMGGIELAKYDGIDFTPPQGVRDNAKRALDVREGKPPSQRGMTPVGIARARDLINGVKLSPDTVKRMLNFLTRHEVDKKGSTWDEQGKGWQAWHGWGGDAGFSWAKKIVGQMEARDKKTEFASESSDEVLNPCGQIDNGTFDKENTCAVGYGRPKLKGGYEPKRQASQPKEAPKGTNAPEPQKEPENPIDYNKERTRIADKISNNNKVKVDLPKDIKISQQIEKQYDNLLAKGYQIPPPETIGTLELTRKSRNAYAIARATYTPEGKLKGQSIYYNTKYDNNSKKGLISSVERNVEIKWLGTTDVLSHEYAHVLHKDIIPYEEARRYRRGKFGTGNVATERRKIAGEVSEYAQKNPMEFVAETFATHVNGKRHSKSVLEMYKFYRGPELK